ncbi:MAG: tRNA uridine-5-carboxymethylaminomethyl(34) synthesis GTPase MnmE, partial [Zetaproteobacteria bacterium]
YTGEDVVELHGHGSPVMLRALLHRLFALGCRPAEPGEFTRQAVLNGKMDLAQAEAVAACIDAATVRAGKQAQLHLAGAFGRKVESIMDCLTGHIASLEACLDFSDDDLPDLNIPTLREQLEREVCEPIRRLVRSASFGMRLFEGASIAIVGAPNVGKSSLLNVLSGIDRAIVSEVPGTTRDVLEVDFEIEGVPVRLVDTAGLRETQDTIELEGIRRARKAAETADVVVFVSDGTRPETWSAPAEADIRLMNKSDLCADAIFPQDFLSISAKTGQGVDRFRSELASRLVNLDLSGEDIFVTRERHRFLLGRALSELEQGMDSLDEETLDLVAAHWRRAYDALAEILGFGDVESILDRIFSSFCIGK